MLKESLWKMCFLHYIGTKCTSFHNVAQKSYENLLNDVQDLWNMFKHFINKDRKDNILILMDTIYLVWILFI